MGKTLLEPVFDYQKKRTFYLPRNVKQWKLNTFDDYRRLFWTVHPDFKKFYKKTWKDADYVKNGRGEIRVAFYDYMEFLYNQRLMSKSKVDRISM